MTINDHICVPTGTICISIYYLSRTMKENTVCLYYVEFISEGYNRERMGLSGHYLAGT